MSMLREPYLLPRQPPASNTPSTARLIGTCVNGNGTVIHEQTVTIPAKMPVSTSIYTLLFLFDLIELSIELFLPISHTFYFESARRLVLQV